MIPLEILTFLGSSVLGGGMSVIKMVVESQMKMNESHRQDKAQQESNVEAARKWMPKMGEWTRRVIVFAVIGSAFIAPTIGPMLLDDITVNYLYNEESRWLFSYDKLKIMTVTGITILPLHTHMASCIGGFYFGTKVGRS